MFGGPPLGPIYPLLSAGSLIRRAMLPSFTRDFFMSMAVQGDIKLSVGLMKILRNGFVSARIDSATALTFDFDPMASTFRLRELVLAPWLWLVNVLPFLNRRMSCDLSWPMRNDVPREACAKRVMAQRYRVKNLYKQVPDFLL